MEKKPGLEDMLMKFMTKMDSTVGELASTVNTVKAATEQNTASIKILERQVGQISEALQNRPSGAFPSMPEKTNREHCNAIHIRSGKELTRDPVREPAPKEVEEEFEMVNLDDLRSAEEPVMKESKKDDREKPKEKEVQPPVKPVVPSVPFPSRLKKNTDDVNFLKFLDVFKKLTINIPFADALAQMPSYMKFMKEILSKKRALDHQSTVALTEECSAIIRNKLPPKLKDPGSFSIPIQIGDFSFDNVLCDLGASINLMPLSVFRKLGLGEVSPTFMTLKLADRSIIYPWGVVEDVLIKVGKFYFPVDFVVIDIDEDKEVPLILGRSFLATSRALIDMEEGELTLRVGGERVTFKILEKGRVEEKAGDGHGKPREEEFAGNRKCGRSNSANTEPN